MTRRDPSQPDLMTALSGDVSTADFSDCQTYRYTLTRTWDSSIAPLVMLMLNPSTADQVVNDPTVERCQRRAKRMGAGGLVVVNIFALRSTDPDRLYHHEDPIGPRNDQSILDACAGAMIVIGAWGTHGAFKGRGDQVAAMVRDAGFELHALGTNKDGSPKHPLYLQNLATPVPYRHGCAD